MAYVDSPAHLRDKLAIRIKAEYSAMPGLSVTPAQAARLWAIDPFVVETALHDLVEGGYLQRTADGRFLLTEAGRRTCAWFLDW